MWQSIPDWAELFIAALSLLAGGAGGTYVGARKRLRLDDRRALALIAESYRRGLTSALVGVSHPESLKEPIESYGLSLDVLSGSFRAAQLPWHDRAEWHVLCDAAEACTWNFENSDYDEAPLLVAAEAVQTYLHQMAEYTNPVWASGWRRFRRKAYLCTILRLNPFAASVRDQRKPNVVEEMKRTAEHDPRWF